MPQRTQFSVAALAALETRHHLENGVPMIDLNTLIPPNSSLLPTRALAINDCEEISGIGVPAGCGDENACGHAYVLIPCEEGEDGGGGENAVLQTSPASEPRDQNS